MTKTLPVTTLGARSNVLRKADNFEWNLTRPQVNYHNIYRLV